MCLRLILIVYCGLLLVAPTILAQEEQTTTRIAVIGGGISGSFATKYLVDYDRNCTLDKIDVFDPFPLGARTPVDRKPDAEWQGSRVASLELNDARIVEIGASVAHPAFALVLEMMNSNGGNDDDDDDDDDDSNGRRLVVGPPFNTGSEEPEPGVPKGFGVYGGKGYFPVLLTSTPGIWNKLKILWRYNFELFALKKASEMAARSFLNVYPLLDDPRNHFFGSPDEMWNEVGLAQVVRAPFDEVLDAIGLARELSWWRRCLPYQGLLREELTTAINLVNYNQDNSQVNGLVGLASFATSQGKLFSVVGGNTRLIRSAFEQAQQTRRRNQKCDGDNENKISHIQETVATVVGDPHGYELYNGNGDRVGETSYDAVVLAAPLQQCRISFFVKSHMDGAALHPMPLSGTHDPDEEEEESNNPLFPRPLPECATNPYTPVVTTVVSNATLQRNYFGLAENDNPRAVFMTRQGKLDEHNITAISQITADTGVFKVFSREALDEQVLQNVFGPGFSLLYAKAWTGPHGGATPDYRGGGASLDYLLYDGAEGLEGHTKSGGLYYTNSIESSIACMEASAIGAKSVAKLIAKRFGWLSSSNDARDVSRDEL